MKGEKKSCSSTEAVFLKSQRNNVEDLYTNKRLVLKMEHFLKSFGNEILLKQKTENRKQKTENRKQKTEKKVKSCLFEAGFTQAQLKNLS
jgi:hypothetical protein